MTSQVALAARSPRSSHIATAAASWLDDFVSWLSPSLPKCCREHDQQQGPPSLRLPPPGASSPPPLTPSGASPPPLAPDPSLSPPSPLLLPPEQQQQPPPLSLPPPNLDELPPPATYPDAPLGSPPPLLPWSPPTDSEPPTSRSPSDLPPTQDDDDTTTRFALAPEVTSEVTSEVTGLHASTTPSRSLMSRLGLVSDRSASYCPPPDQPPCAASPGACGDCTACVTSDFEGRFCDSP